MRSPRFRTKDVSTCVGSTTARGSSSASHCAERMLPSLQQNEIGTSEFDPFRSSIPSPWYPLIAVGTRVTPRHPHRSVRAPLRHTAPTLGGNGEANARPGMKDSGLREKVIGQPYHPLP
jgi:hypothetical protein